MKKTHIACLVLPVLLGASSAQGQTSYYWYPTGNGTFGIGGNWVEGDGQTTGTVPGTNDYAYIGRISTTHETDYTITLETDHEVTRLLHNSGYTLTVTLDLGSHTLTKSGGGSYSFRVDGTGSANRTTRLENGTLTSTDGSLTLGRSSTTGGWGIMEVGAGATLNMSRSSGDGVIEAGASAPGLLRVEDGGKVFVGTPSEIKATVFGNTFDGALFVDGSGEFEMDRTTTRNYLTFGNAGGNATLSITNGGTVKGAYISRFGFGANATVNVLIDGSRGDGEGGTIGSSFTTDRLNIGLDSQSATATVKVSNGGVLSVTRAESDVGIQSSTVEIDGGTIDFAGGALFGDGATYKLTLHDASATPFSAGGDSTLATTGDGVTFELGDMAYGSYWADFVARDGATPFTGTLFDVLVYGALESLDGTFADIDDNDTLIQTPDGQWEFVMHYAYSPTGGMEEDYRIALELVTIPEPQTLGLVLLGVAGVFLRRFRRG